jgi:hypothetical protein
VAITTGESYKQWVAGYLLHNFGPRGIEVFTEVKIGKSIIGKNRTVDLLVLLDGRTKAVAFECKLQLVSGTADEKIPYTLNDAESMQMDKYVVYAGTGWSKGVRHMLEAHELACHAEPQDLANPTYERTAETRELDHVLAMRCGWWDILIENKQPFRIVT